jgi:hypothetical protein
MPEKEIAPREDCLMTTPPTTPLTIGEGEFVCAIAAVANDKTMTTLIETPRSERGIADLVSEVNQRRLAR